jgi:hypothetical protein
LSGKSEKVFDQGEHERALTARKAEIIKAKDINRGQVQD